jgi:hypothetical protein
LFETAVTLPQFFVSARNKMCACIFRSVKQRLADHTEKAAKAQQTGVEP